jgi:hypothetical protein
MFISIVRTVVVTFCLLYLDRTIINGFASKSGDVETTVYSVVLDFFGILNSQANRICVDVLFTQ